MTSDLELWIGLVEFVPLNKKEYQWAGAFTNIVTWAHDANSFRERVEGLATTLKMRVIDVEGAAPVAERCRSHILTGEIDNLVIQARSNPNAVLYGTFFTHAVE